MKIGIFSDEHLDVYKNLSNGLIDEETGYSIRLAEMVKELKRQKTSMLEQGVEYIIHAGDLFNSRTAINAMTLQAATEMLSHEKDNIKQELLIAGNHDEYLFDVKITSIAPFEEYEHVFILSKVHSHFMVDNITIIGIPHHNNIQDFKNQILRLREIIKSGTNTPVFLVTHQELSNIPLSSSGILSDSPISSDDLSIKGIDWIINGHHHFPMRKGNVLIPGSAMQLNYGDSNSKRGYWIIDIESNIPKQYENKARKFYTLPYSDLKKSPSILEEAKLNKAFVKIIVDKKKTTDICDEDILDLPNVQVQFMTKDTVHGEINEIQTNFDPIKVLTQMIDEQDDFDKKVLEDDLKFLLKKIDETD